MKLCPDCLERYPADQVRCVQAQHPRLLELSDLFDPRIATLVDGRYLLLGRLGEGAMGVVYRAWQRSTAREVALKILPYDPHAGSPQQPADPLAQAEMRARFRREVQLAARIDSDYVARVHDSGELPDGSLYFTMEKVQGTTLDKLLVTEGRLAPSQVVRLGRGLGQALAVVHGLGLVHRDIKPSNLMMVPGASGEGTLKLLDFGIARAFEVDVQMGRAVLTNLTTAGTLLGSFAYMAPEQISPSRGAAIGPTADVYASGVTLFELATGRLPFAGPTAPAFAYQHREAPIPSLSVELGDDSPLVMALERVIARALAKNPAGRYADGAALAEALTALTPARAARPSQLVIDTVPEGMPAGALAGLVDPAALRGISTDDVRARAAGSGVASAKRPRFSKGRIAFGLALALGATTVLWDLIGTLPR